ncbi:uncharacterized protein OCT59_000056 [Rhizophagus irregularis]|uniref:L domain-like protein n=5 Tax=Rhizophagus irregularis TaxID=588596 RepID=A0A2N1NEK1_9GLOM|nr:hypothetical protein RirG_166440 [Rhizophagus irregularis DAOM 197198w]PKK72244.1 L domain-like protein [Rhizophagus irregularis]UZN98770.1 hypothetical protein OCT59_000056 [Rhizophagus irregularis]CAB4382359.1 unnamed protein product [Rhizophagus irregularis]CAB4490930.1 unnamed protein product [Rhizophagus irregularis]
MESIEEERERSAFSSESDSDNYESQRAKKKKVKAQYPKSVEIEIRNPPPAARNNNRINNSTYTHSDASTLIPINYDYNNSPPVKKKSFFSKLFSKISKLFWWKKKKEKKEIATLTKEEKKKLLKKKKKKRNCCLIIILIIIILILLGNIAALDVAYAAYRNSPISNITNLVNDFTPAQEQNLKSTICSTLLGTTPPLNFNCEFCWDDNSFYNVTQFCMLKSVYINAINRTMFELNNWMEDINYCKWVGVKCDDSNNVVELLLEFPIIPRFLDTRIGQLKTLQKFTLIGGNKLPNNLMSTSLFQLENLRELFITSTGLTGKIPNTFDKMTSLKTLRLTNNRQLSDPIPDSIAKTSLEILVYAMQNITGVIPDFIGNSPTLQQSLIMLDLSSNLYTGGIPDSIMNLKNLKTLSVAFNLLSGEFPSIITSKFAKSLVFLDLNSNNFSGIIPPSIVQCENLKTINLESNSFTGQIPAELSKLQLFDLLLSDNKLSGEIPATIGDIKLNRLRLAINGLTGLIPNGICQQKYSFCDLHTNQFTSVPASCSVCTL